MVNVRWAFNISKWEPSENELLLATSCLQLEEKQRIDRFVFRKDIKASLAGRLMIRKFVSMYTGLPYNTILLSRDSRNKPIFNASEEVSFNIGHHGNYTVLAGQLGKQNIGIDVMKLEYSGGKTLTEFFRIMRRNFSFSEWKKIEGTLSTTEEKKIENFFRIWALKESYVKAIGIGLTKNLNDIQFNIMSDLHERKVILDTSMSIGNVKQNWLFEESLLDQSHCISVAREQSNHFYPLSSDELLFKTLDPSELMENILPISLPDKTFCDRYFTKELYP